MKKVTIFAGVVILILVLLVISGFSSYNSLVALEEQVNGSWSQVEVQLQRRADLIPNLVETVKGYAIHEQEAIKAVSEARAKLGSVNNQAERLAVENELSSALSRLLMVVENYPNLKADANFRQLADELAGTENRISVARRDYNEIVRVYNSKIRSFPTVIYAKLLGFEQRAYFEAAPGTEQAPQVNFSN